MSDTSYGKAMAKYIAEHYDRIYVKVPKGQKAVWQEAAKAQHKSLNQLVFDAIEAYISHTKE